MLIAQKQKQLVEVQADEQKLEERQAQIEADLKSKKQEIENLQAEIIEIQRQL